MNNVRLIVGLLWFVLLSLLFATFAVILEMLASLSPDERTILAASLVSVWLLLLLVMVGLPLLRRVEILRSLGDDDLARLVGKAFPQIRDRFLNVLELYQEFQRTGSSYSAELIDAAGVQFAEDVRSLDLMEAVDRSPVRLARNATFALSVGTIFLVALFPTSFPAAVDRIIHFSRPFVPDNAVSFSFHPGSTELIKGSILTATVRITSLSPDGRLDLREPLTFLWKPMNQNEADKFVVVADSPGVFRTTIADIRTNAEYSAVFDGFPSASYQITVLDPPILRSFRVRLDYPRYTGLPPRIPVIL
jgi:hypothetical protein